MTCTFPLYRNHTAIPPNSLSIVTASQTDQRVKKSETYKINYPLFRLCVVYLFWFDFKKKYSARSIYSYGLESQILCLLTASNSRKWLQLLNDQGCRLFPSPRRDNYLRMIMLLWMLFRISSCCLWPLQDVVGGRFDAGQAFVGELSQVNIWDRVLKPVEIQSMANCSMYVPGNVISWLANIVEVFGRGAFKRPLEMCQERLPNAWNSSVCLFGFLPFCTFF